MKISNGANIFDGRALAEEIKEKLKKEVKALGKKLRLVAVLAENRRSSLSFVKRKQIFGRDIGIDVEIKRPPENVLNSRKKFRSWLASIVHEEASHGIVIQLPLPENLDKKRQYFLDSIISEKDVDILSSCSFGKFATGQLDIQPPVVEAVSLICQRENINLNNKNIVVVGAGTLVGRPAAVWLLKERLPFSLLVRDTPHFLEVLSRADVIISGVGQAGLIQTDMVKEGVIAFDAGASSEAGEIKGDLDPKIAGKASFFTPVPGGIGPLTVAALFKNLIALVKTK
ncbi:MAG: bifunctional 5,10-methylenetetrahydrofolate dehydrogenase/5,10-methenyltetrahydrofolate cyclohydrolase [Patescibacteria group bacterium]